MAPMRHSIGSPLPSCTVYSPASSYGDATICGCTVTRRRLLGVCCAAARTFGPSVETRTARLLLRQPRRERLVAAACAARA